MAVAVSNLPWQLRPIRVISFHTIFICQFTNLVGSVIFSLSNIEQKSELQSTNIPPYPYPFTQTKIKIYLFLFSSSGQEMFEFIQLIFRLVGIQTLSQGMCTWLMQTPIKQSLLSDELGHGKVTRTFKTRGYETSKC